jgi:hypothetical protein
LLRASVLSISGCESFPFFRSAGEAMAKRAPAKKAPAKRKPRPKKPVPADVPIVDPTDYGEPVQWKWLSGLAMLLSPFLFVGVGVWMAGGIQIGGDVVPNDCLSQAHAADRVSQVRILREYVGKTFPDEPTAMKWLNEQRIEARKTDWIPYTDELGAAADSGPEAVKAFADNLEKKR